MLRNLSMLSALALVISVSVTNLAEGQDATRTSQAETSISSKKKCPTTFDGIHFYRQKVWGHQDFLGIPHTHKSSQPIIGCKYAEWVRVLWKTRNNEIKKKVNFRTLHDPGDWNTAIKISQRVFPGTASWLWNCSGAEGGHGSWVPYRDYGRSYYPGYENTDAVGGWMQFRPSTIRDAWPKTYAWLVRHGWKIADMSWMEAWFSPLAQALSASYYREIEGSAGHHWSASVGNGC